MATFQFMQLNTGRTSRSMEGTKPKPFFTENASILFSSKISLFNEYIFPCDFLNFFIKKCENSYKNKIWSESMTTPSRLWMKSRKKSLDQTASTSLLHPLCFKEYISIYLFSSIYTDMTISI